MHFLFALHHWRKLKPDNSHAGFCDTMDIGNNDICGHIKLQQYVFHVCVFRFDYKK